MMKLLVLVCCAAFASAGTYPLDPRISGGDETTDTEYYTVSVQNSGNHICGGTILTPSTEPGAPTDLKFILTAAHCVYGLQEANLKVLVGATQLSAPTTYANRQLVEVTKIHPHPDFDIFDLSNDIAVLEVKPIKNENNNIKTVEIATDIDLTQDGQTGELSGWGRETEKAENMSDKLRLVKQTIKKLADCKKGDNQFCAEGSSSGTTKDGACFGDAGGPLLKIDGTPASTTNKQVGIASYGYGCSKGNPDVFTYVYAHRDFVNKILEGKAT